MVTSDIPRISVAIATSALIMLLAWFDWPFLKLLSSVPYDRAVAQYCYVDHWRSDPSQSATVLSIAILVLSPVGVAVFTAFSVASSRILSGAFAAGTSALVAYLAVHFWFAALCDRWSFIPNLLELSGTVAAFATLGAFSAWLALRWRSDRSLGADA